MFDDRVMFEELENYMADRLEEHRRDYILKTLTLMIKSDGFEGLTVPEITFMAYCFYRQVLDWSEYETKGELHKHKQFIKNCLDVIIQIYENSPVFLYTDRDKKICVNNLKFIIQEYTETKQLLQTNGMTV